MGTLANRATGDAIKIRSFVGRQATVWRRAPSEQRTELYRRRQSISVRTGGDEAIECHIVGS
jgi:hypothetical protein